jgi:glycosyltransferase involved in cell wall biosynthesis
MAGLPENNILISVVIPSYNRASLLPRTIESIIKQKINDIEIIIADDGSKDNTEQVVKELSKKHPFIRYIKNPINKGEAAARNLGIKAVTGKYVAFLDSDDEWLPNKLSLQLDLIENNPDKYDLVICDYYLVDESGHKELIQPRFPQKKFSSKNLLQQGCNVSFGSTSLLKAKVLDKIGEFDEELPILVDVDWLCRFCENNFKLGKIDQPLVLYYKAPMRKGEMLEAGVRAFKKKNKNLLEKYSFIDRMKIESQFYNYISHSFMANGPFNRFFDTRLRYFALNPLRNIKDYLDFIQRILKHFLFKT